VSELNGSLFFGSVKNFLDLFTPEDDPDDVIIEFQNSRVVDHSAIEAIDNLAKNISGREKIILTPSESRVQNIVDQGG